MEKTIDNRIASKTYVAAAIECTVLFTIATFCLGVFFTHHGLEHLYLSILIIALYLFIVVTTTIRLIQRSTIAAIMLMIPIAPLFIFIIVLSLLHLLQLLK